MEHTYNLSTSEAKIGGLQIQDWTGLHRRTCSSGDEEVVTTANIKAPSGHKIRIKGPCLQKIALCTFRMLYKLHDYEFNVDYFVCKVRLECSFSYQTYWP